LADVAAGLLESRLAQDVNIVRQNTRDGGATYNDVQTGQGPNAIAVDPNDTVNTKAELSAWLNQWCNAFLTATGVRPIVYTYQSYASTYLDSTVTQWPLWIANWNGQNSQTYVLPAGSNGTGVWPASAWKFWQFDAGGDALGPRPIKSATKPIGSIATKTGIKATKNFSARSRIRRYRRGSTQFRQLIQRL
jgi:hypothetical protein